MAGKIIVSSVQSDTDNSISFVANTGATIFSANLSHGIAGSFIADGTITAAKIADGAIVATEVADGAITTTKIASNTISNTNIATGAVENYLRANALDFGMRNKIINGAMVIDQRNAGATVTVSDAYTLDRWSAYENTSGSMTIGQSTTAPAGFRNSLLVTITGTASSLGTNIGLLRQYVEGFNAADLMWGTANAKTVTLSFWVRSSVTGTFTGVLQNADNDYAYAFTYTISSANTWEQKTVTVTGATSGTWNTTNGRGIELDFSLGSATGLTAESWVANGVGGNYYYAATGQTNLFATNGATFYITGVQLEEGSTATSFEYRQYGTELALCQRYYYQVTAGSDSFTQFGVGRAFSGTAGNGIVPFPVPMRAKPTFAFLGVVGNYDFGPTAISGGAVPASNTHMTVGMTFSSITSGSIFVLGQSSSSTPCGFTFSAEL